MIAVLELICANIDARTKYPRARLALARELFCEGIFWRADMQTKTSIPLHLYQLKQLFHIHPHQITNPMGLCSDEPVRNRSDNHRTRTLLALANSTSQLQACPARLVPLGTGGHESQLRLMMQ